MLARWLVVLCLWPAAAPAAQLSSGGFAYAVEKAPAWASSAAPDAKSLQRRDGYPFHTALFRLHMRLTGDTTERYVREVSVANDATGVERLAQVRIYFNPAFEKLTLHSVALLRDGRRMEKLGRVKVDMLRRELALESNIYGGLVTAHLVLDDVRAGDAIDVAYTIGGANPVFAGRFGSTIPVGSIVPVDRQEVVLQHPRQRQVYFKMFGLAAEPKTVESGDARKLEWTFRDLPAVSIDDGLPSWYPAIPYLQLTEYKDWNEVAQWAEGLFRTSSAASPKLNDIVARLQAGAADDDTKIVRALDFVQKEVRYFGIELGENSHRPADPNVVLERRFGDCKDKSALLVAMLKAMGIKAYPVFVSFKSQAMLVKHLPSATLFDHAIVGVPRDKGTLWLDPTNRFQKGEVNERVASSFGYGLPVQRGVSELSAVEPPGDRQELVHFIETYDAKDPGKPPELTALNIYHGEIGEKIRSAYEQQPRERIEQYYVDFYRLLYPTVTAQRPLVIDDQPGKGQVRLTEHYLVPDFLKYEGHRLDVNIGTRKLASFLPAPRAIKRRTPFDVGFRGTLRHDVIIIFPKPFGAKLPEPVRLDNKFFTYAADMQADGQQLKYRQELRLRRDIIQPDEIEDYVREAARARNEMFMKFGMPVADKNQVLGVLEKYRQDLEAPARSGQAAVRKMQAGRLMDVDLYTLDIQSGALGGRLLSQAYYERGKAYSNLDRKDEALEDLTKAVAADAKAADAYVVRAEIYTHLGRFQDAEEDFKRAEALGATRTAKSRGQLRYYMGDYAGAARYLDQAVERDDTSSGYALMWWYFAAQRAGMDARGRLKERLKDYSERGWPRPILEYLAGRLPESELLERARSADPKDDILQRCEMYFYLGQQALLDGRRAEARRWFQQTLETEVTDYLEYAYAKREIERLKSAAAQ